jgi:hypothetical protein
MLQNKNSNSTMEMETISKNIASRKNFLRIVCFSLLTIFVSCTAFSQSPAISKKYSDEEIIKLIQNYEKSNHRDVMGVDNVLLQRFRRDFANAFSVEWETNDELYEVEFEIKDRDFKAFYDKDGNLLMYKQEIRERELPKTVKKAAKANYAQYRFEDLEKIAKGTQIFYKVEMEYREAEVTMFITDAGEFLK